MSFRTIRRAGRRAQVADRSNIVRAAALAASVALTGQIATAAPLYWDGDGTVPGGAAANIAPGTWGVSNFWSTSSAGSAVPGAWVTDSTAVFSAGTDVTGTYSVTVDGTQQAAGIIFEEGTVTLNGGALTLNDPAPTITIGTGTGGRNARINSAITAANALHIARGTTGNATLNLGGVNSFAAGIFIDGAVRINANVDGALGVKGDGTNRTDGTITVTASGAGISTENNAAAATLVNLTNDIVFAPTTPADDWNFSLGCGKQPDGLLDVQGNISGTGNLILTADPLSTNSNGNGVVQLSGTNTYSGATIVNISPTNGVFRLNSAGALPSTTTLILGRNTEQIGDVDLNGQDITIAGLATNLPAVTNDVYHGITNSNGSAGGSITITGDQTTTFARPIGDLPTVTGVNLPSKTTNLSLTLAASHTGNLTLSDVNNYAGPTTINGGTLTVANAGNTIAGVVNVNSGGTLASQAGTQATVRGVGGMITVNSGGFLAPGGAGVGTLAANGGLTINGGANIDFNLVALTNYDQINLGGNALTLDSGAHTVDIIGVAGAGTYTLMNYGSLVSDGTNLFTLGSTPGGAFAYNLATGDTALTLTITPTVQTLAWDIGGGGPPIVDGASVTPWADGSTDFTDLSTSAGATFSNAGSADIVFGSDAAASGGLIQLGGDVRTGGMLTFGTISAAAPYTIGDAGTTSTLTTVGGITANGAVATTINAPIILEASQTWNVTSGSTLVTNATIADGAGGAKTITKSGAGVLQLLAPSNSFSGGLVITAGRVEANSDAAMGPGDVTVDTNGQFRFIAPFSTDNNFVVGSAGGQIFTDAANPATITGNITGPGRLQKEGGGAITLLGTNTFSSLLVGNGMIYVNSEAALGLGDIEVNSGGLGAASASWSTSKNILFSGDHFNEDIRTNGFDITLSGVISGEGDLFKYDAGTLVLSGANTYTGNTIVHANNLPAGAGTIRTMSTSALGTGNLQVQAPLTLDVASDLVTGAIRGASTLTKTGPGLLSLSGSTTNGNVGGTLIVNEGAVQMNSRESLGGVNPAAGAATTTQMNIVLNPGTELLSNWGHGSVPRRGGSITLNGATFRRLATSPNESVYNAFNGDAYYGDVLTVSGNSTIANEQLSNGTGVNNLAFDMPVVLQAGATLTLHNDNNLGDYDAYNLSLRGTNNTIHSAYDNLTMNDGSSIVMTGPGEKRLGGIATGKPIIVNGNATLKLDSRTFMSDLDGSGTGNEFTKLTINGGGLRIEAPMNASYTTPIDPEPLQQPEEGFTGFFGVNTTSTAEGGTPPAGYSVIGNAYTVFSPKRANGLAGSTGTITLAATNSESATGRIEHGPSAPTGLRLALDNTAASAGAELVYEIDAQANGGTFGNFAGLDVKRTNTGAGGVKAKLVNSVMRVASVTVAEDARLDINDKILITDDAVGTWNGTAYTGIQGEVGRAYDFGAWDLPGIMTSQPDAGPTVGKATVGVATGEQVAFLAPGETGVFAGQTITSSSSIAMYTWAGDADLNGYVDAVDYGTIDQWIQFPGTTGYTNGDLNYDGVIDAVDYGIIDNGIQLQGPPMDTSGGGGGAVAASIAGVTAVPEPASLSVFALAAASLLGRRRRRRSH